MPIIDNKGELRIDRWLWAVRLYKARTDAAHAVRAGHVRVNGARVKPSKPVKPQDQVMVAKGPFTFELTVVDIPSRRGPAREAMACYVESDQSLEARAERRSIMINERGLAGGVDGRPDKRTRRLIRSRRRGRSDP